MGQKEIIFEQIDFDFSGTHTRSQSFEYAGRAHFNYQEQVMFYFRIQEFLHLIIL
jgi:hypothetical protein